MAGAQDDVGDLEAGSAEAPVSLHARALPLHFGIGILFRRLGQDAGRRHGHPSAIPQQRSQRRAHESAQDPAHAGCGADQEAATDRIRQLKDAGRRCDNVIPAIARSSASTQEAVVLTATSRHYKRIGGHLLNLFTSVVMPLHKVDYYDESGIQPPPKLR